MPLRTYKKARTESDAPSTPATSPAVSSKSSSSPHRSLADLPKEVLARVAASVGRGRKGDPDDDARSDLLALASTCSALRQAAISCFNFSVRLDSPKAVVGLAKVFGQKTRSSASLSSLVQCIQVLAVELESLSSPKPPSFSTLSSSFASLFPAFSGITTLELYLPPHESLASLFSTDGDAFILRGLSNLRSFTLRGGFVWFHELLTAWNKLEILDLAIVRGDCNSFSPFASNAPPPCKLRNLTIHSSTLTDAMIAHILRGQMGLQTLDISLPGTAGKAWTAIEKVVPKIEVLRLRNSWASTARQKGTKKEEAETPDADELQEQAASPTSPLLPLLKAAKSLETLLLTPAMLPSLPSAVESFTELVSYLAVVDVLELDGFSLTSPLFAALEAALNKHKLPSLERIETQSIVKGKKGPGAKAEKAFEQACRKHGVEWVTGTDD
ncbi:Proteophosphoglycan ppg4 [Rhodotorula toruloides ATCC 204091]|uniref:Proteophosphoglycan ppg4 n=1 Tax=Rhodotorula toruloides TaxID=5286 RepID=A0A2T0A551_RHOTO|nr:Proteophosphoglycan ppg4 [Rhodotorula toruloides ATCC 204091]KAK4331712.1 Proteophosphoglycan ppg4 [Rhodotorula toruloides]PRQ73123.1 Proteophosphoglycan ppg4 [Rhodotorula toruloides]